MGAFTPGELIGPGSFGWLSFGIQDADPAVQQAVNRLQDEEWTLFLIRQSRRENAAVQAEYAQEYPTGRLKSTQWLLNLILLLAGFGLRVGDANVVKADIEASNGVIHVIDRVLIP